MVIYQDGRQGGDKRRRSDERDLDKEVVIVLLNNPENNLKKKGIPNRRELPSIGMRLTDRKPPKDNLLDESLSESRGFI